MRWQSASLIFDEGRVIADGTPEALKAGMAGDLITIGTNDSNEAARAAGVVRRLDDPREITVDGSSVRLRTIGGATALPGLLRALDAIGVAAVSAEIKRPTLDDVFLELTGRSLRDDGDLAAAGAIPSTQPTQTLEIAS